MEVRNAVMGVRVIGLIAAIGLLVAASAPTAIASWSTPLTVSSSHAQIDDLFLASGSTGSLLNWRHWDFASSTQGVLGPAQVSYALASAGARSGPSGHGRRPPS